jgi:nascent polypeptide-associated complex subunit alpha
MIPGMNPKKMQALMKQMGMAQEDIDATRVIIEKTDGTNITINNPEVAKVNMQGNTSYQVSGGDVEETTEEDIEQKDTTNKLAEDIVTIVSQTGCTEEQAAIELEKTNNDIAEAIINLSK